MAGGLAPVAVVHAALEAGAALVDEEIVVVAVGKGDVLTRGRTGHSVLNVLVAFDLDGQSNRVLIVHTDLEGLLTEVALDSMNTEILIKIFGRGTVLFVLGELEIRVRGEKLNRIYVTSRERSVRNITDFIRKDASELAIRVAYIFAVGNGFKINVKCFDLNLVLDLIRLGVVGDGGGDGSITGLFTGSHNTLGTNGSNFFIGTLPRDITAVYSDDLICISNAIFVINVGRFNCPSTAGY